MNLKRSLILGGKLAGLILLYVVAFLVGALLFPIPVRTVASPADAGAKLAGVFVMAAVNTLVVALVILRSRWSGWRLMATLAFSLYGVMTFMAQIETAWFGAAMNIPKSWLPPLFLGSLPIVLGFVPLAILILGKGRDLPEPAEPPLALPQGIGAWAWRLTLIALIYAVLYFSAGFVVAWQNPALRELYGNGADQRVFNLAYLFPFQLLRGVLWTLFALPVLRMTRGSAWHVALVVGLFVALPMNMTHAIPNSLMADSVRLSHFIETVSSNFLFGLALTGVLLWRPTRAAQLLSPFAGSR